MQAERVPKIQKAIEWRKNGRLFIYIYHTIITSSCVISYRLLFFSPHSPILFKWSVEGREIKIILFLSHVDSHIRMYKFIFMLSVEGRKKKKTISDDCNNYLSCVISYRLSHQITFEWSVEGRDIKFILFLSHVDSDIRKFIFMLSVVGQNISNYFF